MAKFRIESGAMRLVVQAHDAHKAAIWAVHCCMQQALPGESDGLSEAASRGVGERPGSLSHVGAAGCTDEYRSPVGCQVLDEFLWVQPEGVSLQESGQRWRFSTLELVRQWNQLMSALAELDAQLERGMRRQMADSMAQTAA